MAFAAAPPPSALTPALGKIFLSVDSEIAIHHTAQWSHEQCRLLDEKIEVARGTPSHGACASPTLTGDFAGVVAKAKASGSFVTHLALKERADSSLQLIASDWSANASQLEKEEFVWNLEAPDRVGWEQQQQSLVKLVHSFLVYLGNKQTIREIIVKKASPLSDKVLVTQGGQFLHKEGRYPLSGREAVTSFVNESPNHKHFLRTAVELVGILAVSEVIYQMQISTNKKDWMFQTTWDDQTRRLIEGDGYRMDDNPFWTNAFTHPVGGALYYTAARTNGYSALQSFLFAFAGSAVWETVCEYHEIVSLNDMVTTAWGGAVLGEVFYQFGRFFNRSSGTMTHTLLGSLFGGFERVHNWLDKNHPQVERDSAGHPADTWHDFRVFGGLKIFEGENGASMNTANLGLEMEVFNIRTYDKVGVQSKLMSDTAFAKMVYETSLGESGFQDIMFMAKTAIAGYYQQNIRADEQARRNGYSFFIGLANRFDFRTRTEGFGPQDVQCMVGVLGSTLQVTMFVRDVRVRLNIDVYGDFAMIRTYAMEDYMDWHGTAQLKSPEKRSDYAFGLGVSPETALSVKFKRLEVGASYLVRNIHSIDTLDVFLPEEDALHSEDSYSEAKASATYAISERVHLRYAYQTSLRQGSLDDHSRTSRTKSHSLGLEFLF